MSYKCIKSSETFLFPKVCVCVGHRISLVVRPTLSSASGPQQDWHQMLQWSRLQVSTSGQSTAASRMNSWCPFGPDESITWLLPTDSFGLRWPLRWRSGSRGSGKISYQNRRKTESEDEEWVGREATRKIYREKEEGGGECGEERKSQEASHNCQFWRESSHLPLLIFPTNPICGKYNIFEENFSTKCFE